MNEPHAMPEDDFGKMVVQALQAHGLGHPRGVEPTIAALLQHVNDQNGKGVIVGPDGKGVRLNIPSAQELDLLILNGLRVCLQTARVTLLALNDMDSRLRASQTSPPTTDLEGFYRPATINPADRDHDNGCPTWARGECTCSLSREVRP